MADRVLETRSHNGLDGFQALESDWRSLEKRAPATVFQSWDWCNCWLARHPQVTPRIITVGSDRDVSAIFPLGFTRTWRGLPVRRLAFLGSGPADYGGFLLDGSRGPGLAALAARLGDGGFDLLDLHQLHRKEADELAGLLEGDHHVAVWPQESTMVVETGADFEAYSARLSKRFRKNVTYAARRLERDFSYTAHLDGGDGDLARSMDHFFALHQQRWLSKRLPGLFIGGGNRQLHQELADRLRQTDSLVLGLTYIDDEPAAALYGFKWGQDYSYYLGGFDPQWAKYSVSAVLIYALIKESCAQGYQRFDFLRGREAYKQKWLAEEVPLYRLVAYHGGARGRLGAALAKTENDAVQRIRARLHQ